jgi:hypothetical protein
MEPKVIGYCLEKIPCFLLGQSDIAKRDYLIKTPPWHLLESMVFFLEK